MSNIIKEIAMLTTIADLALTVKSSADRLFPNRTDASMYLKLYEETAEVISTGGDSDEVADVFILWLDYAARKGIDIEAVVRRKLNINEERAWTETETGIYHHVKR